MTVHQSDASAVRHRRAVLVVDDDTDARRQISSVLRRNGFRCVETSSGSASLRLARRHRFDVAIIEPAVTDVDGLAVCRALPHVSSNANIPILCVSAGRAEQDILDALESGADDYVVKQCGSRELVARVEALLRRRTTAARADLDQPLRCGHVEVIPSRRSAIIADRTVSLTQYEFQMLFTLVCSQGAAITRKAIADCVWMDRRSVPLRHVDALVTRVRKKVEPDPGRPTIVLTARGVGYRVAHPVPRR